MTEAQLENLLARNPQLRACDNSTGAQISAPLPQPGTARPPDGDCGRDSQGKERAFVCFIFRRTRLLDLDAVAGSSKDLLDGLQDSGLISGDSEDAIAFEAVQQKVGKKRDEGTVIYIGYGAEAQALEQLQQKYRRALLAGV